MTVRFLFRHPRRRGHVFLTTEDPTYRYETLCGHCDFPIEQQDDTCPRCQRTLEDCPVCRHRTHKRSPIERPADRPQAKHCPVCRITRHPIGWTRLQSLEGSFCTNLYGCPAGGLLLHSDELAVLPADASICPVCRNKELRPLALAAFQYVLRHCLFCSTLFGAGSSWSRGWSEQPITARSESWIASGSQSCHLCGRNDRPEHTELGHERVKSEALQDDAGLQIGVDPGLPIEAYLRVVELARGLALETDHDAKAFREIVQLWFDPSGEEPEHDRGTSVRELVDHLGRGTLRQEVRGPLQERIDRFEECWQRQLGVGLGYRVALETPNGTKSD